MDKDVLRGVAAVAASVALCTLGITAASVTTGGVAGAAARSPGRVASATHQSSPGQAFRSAPAGRPLRASLATPPACPEGSERPLYLYTRYSFAERAADLVSCMTLAEKIAQLHTFNAPAIPSLGVQQYNYDSEGLHGVYRLGDDTNPGGPAGTDVSATSFPSNFAATMSWDPQLIYAESTAISDEARGFLDKSLWGRAANNLGPSKSDYGSLTYWAPTVNMDRDPRWGRTDESFGEDPYLASQMAGAYVDGYQGETITGQPMTRFLKVAATAKHYALNNVEDDRMAISSNTDDANIRDYYTAQFRYLAENAHLAGLMTSYNAINGTPAVADTYTINELAQRTYGFNGYTTSDCGAVGTTYNNPPGGHDWAPPGWTTNNGGANAVWTNTQTGQQISGAAGGQAYAVRAGTELNCKGPQYTLTNIRDAIKAGVLDEGVLDAALTHVFTVRMETGEFNPPGSVPYTKITKSVIQSPAHQALAEKVAADDLVLLQNGNVSGTSTPLLPADPAKLKKVVVVGNLADTVTLGGYSGDPKLHVNAVQGITAAVKDASPGASVVFDSCHTSTTTATPADCSATTMADIKSADLVVVFVGTDENISYEGTALHQGPDRTTLAMPGNYESLISQVAALGNPRMALVIQSDGPVDIANVQQDFPAIVFSGYNGESQGTALASVLFGATDPSGHLDFTWYAGDSQLPPMSNYGLTPDQTGGLGRTYMYFTGTPTYPFGYGLSYTKFAYSNVSADSTSVPADGTVKVSFTVTNTGNVPGATVAQLYVSTPFTVPGTELPAKRLEAFQRTNVLAPGQSQQITLAVPVPDLSFWDEQQLKETVYDGPYQFGVGPDSADIVAAPQVQVTGSLTPHVQYVTVQPDQVIFQQGQTLNLTGTNPWIASDTNPAMEQQHATADQIVEAVNNDQSFVDLSQATVTYSSSDPAVATVSTAGILTAAAPGAATINVTVDGVTGSAPIVVVNPAGSAGSWSTRQASQAAAQADGAIDVLDKAANTTLGHQWYNPRRGWRGPVSMGSQVVSGEPSVITSVPGTVDAFWQGADGGLWHQYTTAGHAWSSQQPMNLGTLGGPPKAVAQPDGTEDVFWRGTDDHLWYATFVPGTGWSGAQNLGGDLASDPVPLASSPGTFDVFWKGTDGNLWHAYQIPGQGWHAPASLGMGPLGGELAATGQLSGAEDVFWRGTTGNNLWHAYFVAGSGWHGPQNLGGDLPDDTAPIAPVSSVPGTVDVFWKGTDGNLWHAYTTAGHGWHSAASLGIGPLGSMPFATAQPDGTENVFWRGTGNDHLWHAYFLNGGWHGPQDLGGDLYPIP